MGVHFRAILAAGSLSAAALIAVTSYQSDADSVRFHHKPGAADCCLDIAHAGGAIDGRPYTNSLEALDQNHAVGRRVFEIDFIETADHAIALIHDWDGHGGTPMSRSEFLSSGSDLTPLDLEAFVEWLEQCPDCIVVTDPKGDQFGFLDRLRDATTPEMLDRQFVLQVYSVEEAEAVAALLPGQRLIFTAYRRPPLDTESLARLGALPQVIAITMPVDRVDAELPLVRSETGLPVYVHGSPKVINDPTLHRHLADLGVAGFYLE